MISFKEQIEQDLNSTFFNSDEFSESHSIDGKILDIIVDNDRLKERAKKEYDGIYVGDVLFYVKAQDYGAPPKPESMALFDGRPCIVFDVRHDMGMYEIILKFNSV